MLNEILIIAHFTSAPPDFVAFGIAFFMGFIGGYLLWGLLASIVSVISMYLFVKEKKSRRLLWLSCMIGCAIGITLKFLVLG